MSELFVPTSQKGLFANAFGWVLAILAVVAVVAGGVWLWQYETAPIRGKISARNQIKGSGAYRIAAYNHFFDLCAAVQSDEARLAAQRVELTTATGDDRARIGANIAGITADRADAINQYNADAQKGYTLGQFRASGLPFTLNLSTKETSCVTG